MRGVLHAKLESMKEGCVCEVLRRGLGLGRHDGCAAVVVDADLMASGGAGGCAGAGATGGWTFDDYLETRVVCVYTAEINIFPVLSPLPAAAGKIT